MSITPYNLDANDTESNQSSFTTASKTPGANRLQQLIVRSYPTSGNGNPSGVTGCGLTWVQVGALQDSGGYGWVLTRWRALGASPSTGALTVSFAAAQYSMSWIWDEFDGVDTSGTNGSGAIVGTNYAGSTGGTITLAAFGSANNMAHGAFFREDTGALSVGAGFSLLGTNTVSYRGITETLLNTPSVTHGGGARAGLAVEIKAAAGGAGVGLVGSGLCASSLVGRGGLVL